MILNHINYSTINTMKNLKIIVVSLPTARRALALIAISSSSINSGELLISIGILETKRVDLITLEREVKLKVLLYF